MQVNAPYVVTCSVMAADVNGAGRGLNVVVFDPHKGLPKSATRYDTYEKGKFKLSCKQFLKTNTSSLPCLQHIFFKHHVLGDYICLV